MGKILIVNTGPVADEYFKMRAAAAAERVAEYNVSAVYACPVPGAEEAAHIVSGKAGIPVSDLAGFSLSGASPGLELIDASLHMSICNDREKLPEDPGIEEIKQNLGTALDKIAEAHKKENVAVISSRALTVVMILYLLHMHGQHYRQIAQDEGAVNLFEVRSGVPSALYINDICHLRGLV